jgi:endoglucanase
MTDDYRFGYDAVRIPLYLIWGQEATPENMKPFQVFWSQFQDDAVMPSWVDLNNGDMGTYNASMGFHNIARLSIAFPKLDTVHLSEYDPSQGYYSSMLFLFTQSALESLKK